MLKVYVFRSYEVNIVIAIWILLVMRLFSYPNDNHSLHHVHSEMLDTLNWIAK